MVALRGGDVIGDHTIHFLGPGERIEITHRATQRDLFARGGALRAARMAHGGSAGRYALRVTSSVDRQRRTSSTAARAPDRRSSRPRSCASSALSYHDLNAAYFKRGLAAPEIRLSDTRRASANGTLEGAASRCRARC